MITFNTLRITALAIGTFASFMIDSHLGYGFLLGAFVGTFSVTFR